MQYTVLCFVIQLLAAVSFVCSSPIIMNNERKVLMPQQRMTCRLPNNKLVPCSNVPRGGGDEDQNGQIIVNVENNLNPIFKIQLDNPSEGIRSPKRGKSTGVTSSSFLSTVLLKKVQLGQRGLTLAGSSVHSTMKGSVSSVGSSGGSSKVSSLGSSGVSSGASLMKMKSGGSSISSSKSSGSSSSAMAGSSSSSAVTMKSLLPGTFESMADSIVSSFMSIGVSHSSGGSSSNNSPSSGHTSTGASHSSVSKMTGGSSGSSSGHSSSSVGSSGSMSTMTLNAKISLSSGQASSSVGGSSGSSNASSGSSSTGHTSSSGGSSSARSGSTIELTTPSSIVSEFMEIST